jgi:uncharacterized protein YecE (DUF72 family)
MPEWKIGCSGYQYAEWKRIFYPDEIAQRKWFEFYCEHFNSIELNTTFYRFPKIDHLKSWYNRSPANFTFAVKAPRLITHYKRLNEAQDALRNFYDIVREGLREKLGFVLFQFPSSFVFEEHRLERIVNLMNHDTKNVVEFRHKSWWNENVFSIFSENKITFSGMSHPELPDQVIKTTDTVYYRFHGVPHLYSSKYDTETLERVVNGIQSQRQLNDAFIFFNNTAEGAAVVNGKEFMELCESVSRAH